MEKRKESSWQKRSLLWGMLCLFLCGIFWNQKEEILLAEGLPGQAGTVSLAQTKEKAQALLQEVTFQEKEGRVTEPTELMADFASLRQNYYTIDSRTTLFSDDIDPVTALAQDFSLDETVDGPQILIFHTHSHEGFADSDMSKGIEEGIWGVGERLKEILEEKYGIEVLHDTGRYDVVDGKNQITGAYERMEPAIRKILEENPSIQVCIDLHRDGVGENTHLVTEIDGKQCAKIMFFNGMCRLNTSSGVQDIAGLENPYLKDNLAFSLQLQTTAEQFEGFTRKIYLNAYRFSLHMLPRSTLIEVGAQTNTKEEALNAMEPLAKVLAQVLGKA